MTRLCTPLIALCAALALPAAQPAAAGPLDGRAEFPDDPRHDWAPEFDRLDDNEYRLIPLRRAIEIASARFDGRVIAARLTGPTPHERDRGVALVHELRMLTPARDVLRIRIDARSGDFLEVAGAGLTKARRKGHDR